MVCVLLDEGAAFSLPQQPARKLSDLRSLRTVSPTHCYTQVICTQGKGLSLTDLNVIFVQAKGVADAGNAAFRVSGMELGGLFGSLLAGRISDALIARNPKGGNVGKRVQVSFPHQQEFMTACKLCVAWDIRCT